MLLLISLLGLFVFLIFLIMLIKYLYSFYFDDTCGSSRIWECISLLSRWREERDVRSSGISEVSRENALSWTIQRNERGTEGQRENTLSAIREKTLGLVIRALRLPFFSSLFLSRLIASLDSFIVKPFFYRYIHCTPRYVHSAVVVLAAPGSSVEKTKKTFGIHVERIAAEMSGKKANSESSNPTRRAADRQVGHCRNYFNAARRLAETIGLVTRQRAAAQKRP